MAQLARANSWRAIVPAAMLLGWTLGLGTAHGDVVSVQGRPLAVDVKITAIKDGQLVYKCDTGSIERPIEQVRYLQISGWEPFNAAERQLRDRQTKPAIAGFERILEVAPASDDSGLNRRLLVQCRLVRLYDSEGAFESAVGAYLAIAQAMPAGAEALRPTRLPKAGPELAKAARMIEEVVSRRDRLDPVAVALEKWRASWPDVSDVNKATTTSPADTYYRLGQTTLEKAKKAKGQEAHVQRRRAGLAFMRVVIQWPQSPLAAECLFRAGQVCRDNERTDLAAGLWAELIATYPTSVPWAQQARQESSRLKTTK